MTKEGKVRFFAWGLCGAVSVLAFAAWGETYSWESGGMSIYQFFPLLGLLAFSIMWSHYVASAVRQYMGVEGKVLSRYFEVTSMIVLAAILLHPGLLAWQLWRDGLGLPPGSAKLYVGAAAFWAILFGITAWTAFILYEFRRIWGQKRWWPLVQYASDIGMVLIFFHALKLGGALQIGWFKTVWYVYGLTYLAALVYGYSKRSKSTVKVKS